MSTWTWTEGSLDLAGRYERPDWPTIPVVIRMPKEDLARLRQLASAQGLTGVAELLQRGVAL